MVWVPYQLPRAVPPPVLRPRGSSGAWRGAGLRDAEEAEPSSGGFVVGVGVRILLAVSLILERTFLAGEGRGRSNRKGIGEPARVCGVTLYAVHTPCHERSHGMDSFWVYRHSTVRKCHQRHA